MEISVCRCNFTGLWPASCQLRKGSYVNVFKSKILEVNNAHL
jgi:hypothetical protein